jgi:hypothetical protein
VSFRRNRESRSREAAGRRNWPEAVPKKMRGRKSRLSKFSDIGRRADEGVKSGPGERKTVVGAYTLRTERRA